MRGPPALQGDCMPRDIVPHREGPKEEVSTEVQKHNRPFGNARREANMADARESARRGTQAEAHKRDFAKAQVDLAKLNYSQVMDLITSMPMGMQELYLLAEEATANRAEVLRYFPKPGTKARSRWLPESLAPVGA